MARPEVGFVKLSNVAVGFDGGANFFSNILTGGIHSPSSGGLEANAKSRLPRPYRISGLMVRTSNAQPADNDLTVVLRRNGVDTALKVVIPANSPAGAYRNGGVSVDVDTPNDWNWEARKSAGLTSAAMSGISFLMEPL